MRNTTTNGYELDARQRREVNVFERVGEKFGLRLESLLAYGDRLHLEYKFRSLSDGTYFDVRGYNVLPTDDQFLEDYVTKQLRRTA